MSKILYPFKLILITFVPVLLLIGTIETVSYYYYVNSKPRCENCRERDYHSVVGKWNKKNTSHTAVKTCLNGSQCYKARFDYDEYGRRILGNEKESDEHLLYFGCSFVFGEGLNTEDTIPFLTQARVNHRVYNYAKSGVSVSTALRLLESGKVKSEVPEEKGVAIYLLSSVHIDRDSFESHRHWAWRTPSYRIEEEKATYMGNQLEHLRERDDLISSFFLFYTWLYKRSYLLKSLKINFSLFDEQQREDRHLVLLKELKNKYEEVFDGRFIVVGHPMYPPTEAQVSYLRSNSIEYFSTKVSKPIEEYFICECEIHPNRELNLNLSRFILQEVLN